MITHEKEFLDSKKLALSKTLNIKKIQSDIKKANKDINYISYISKEDAYLIATNSGKLYKSQANNIKSLIGTKESEITAPETTFNKNVNYIGTENIKKSVGKKYEYIWIGVDACYATNPGIIYDIGSYNGTSSNINLYNVHGFGDRWWDKHFDSECINGEARTSPILPTLNQLVPFNAYWKQHNANYNYLYNKTTKSNLASATISAGKIAEYNQVPFINPKIDYDTFNSQKILNTYKNSKDLEVLCAFDNGEMVTFNEMLDDTSTNGYTGLNGLTAFIYKNRCTEAQITREFTRTNVPRYIMNLKLNNGVDKTTNYGFKNTYGYPGRMISQTPINISLGIDIDVLSAQRTTYSRYGTPYTNINAINVASTRKCIITLPNNVSFGNYSGQTIANASATLFTDWASYNSDYDEYNKNKSPVFTYEKDK